MTNTLWIILLLAVGAGGLVAGWSFRGKDKEVMPTPESVYTWFSYMSETEMSKILYPMVKNLYFGRRTIHRCPQRKGETTNLFNQEGEK